MRAVSQRKGGAFFDATPMQGGKKAVPAGIHRPRSGRVRKWKQHEIAAENARRVYEQGKMLAQEAWDMVHNSGFVPSDVLMSVQMEGV